MATPAGLSLASPRVSLEAWRRLRLGTGVALLKIRRSRRGFEESTHKHTFDKGELVMNKHAMSGLVLLLAVSFGAPAAQAGLLSKLKDAANSTGNFFKRLAGKTNEAVSE